MDSSLKLDRRRARGLARTAADAPATHGTGQVLVHSDPQFVVEAGTRRLNARRAASCLLLPEAGDTVAWCRGDGDDTWIYAVLERAGTSEQRLQIEGDAAIEVRKGALRVEAEHAVAMRAPKLEADGQQVTVKAGKADFLLGAAQLVASACDATFEKARLVGADLSSVIGRVFQHAKDRHSVVENMDQQKAGTLDLEGRTLVNVHGETVLTNGQRLVKTRGGQIHLG